MKRKGIGKKIYSQSIPVQSSLLVPAELFTIAVWDIFSAM